MTPGRRWRGVQDGGERSEGEEEEAGQTEGEHVVVSGFNIMVAEVVVFISRQ